MRNYDFSKITWPVMSCLSAGDLSLRWGRKMPQIMEVLVTKFQGLGCFRTWEIMVLVKSPDQWRHASQQGVQGVGAGSKDSSCPSGPAYQVWWRMDFYILRYLHFLAKIAYFAICICTLQRNCDDNSKIVYCKILFIWCTTRYTIRQTCVPRKVTRCTK